MRPPILSLTLCIVLLSATGLADDSNRKIKPPGEEKSGKTKVLEVGAKVLQTSGPIAAMDIYMVGFHPMKSHPEKQMEAHHFCRQVNEDFAQCTLFDGNSKNANLNGIEYIISEKLFNQLSTAERKFWHPHNYEILSGQLTAPGLPDAAEKELMKKKMNSYGKTWHVWNTGHIKTEDADKLPLGEPMLAWSFNHDGEANPALTEGLERRFQVSVMEKRKNRSDLVPLANPQEGIDALKSKFKGNIKSIPGVSLKN